MPSFEEMFKRTNGTPIIYQGKTLVMFHTFATEGAKKVRLAFEKCSGEWRQGVAFRFKGSVKVNGHTIKRGVTLWHDTAPQIAELEPVGKTTSLEVNNVWDAGNGLVHSWHNGAAMIVEPIANGCRYYCNDGAPDDDFDDIVFRLERLD